MNQLSSLTELTLIGNPLKVLPKLMGSMADHLRKLHLDPKYVEVPPAEIAVRGVTHALNFLSLVREAYQTLKLKMHGLGLTEFPKGVLMMTQITEIRKLSQQTKSCRCSSIRVRGQGTLVRPRT